MDTRDGAKGAAAVFRAASLRDTRRCPATCQHRVVSTSAYAASRSDAAVRRLA